MSCNTELYNKLKTVGLPKPIEDVMKDIHTPDFIKFFDWKKATKDIYKSGEPTLEKILEYYGLNTAEKTIQKIKKAHEEPKPTNAKAVTTLIKDELTKQKDTGLLEFNADEFRTSRIASKYTPQQVLEFQENIKDDNITNEVKLYQEFVNKIDEEIASWDFLATNGSELHNIIESIVNNNIIKYEEATFSKYNDIFDNENSKRIIINDLITFVNSLKERGQLIAETDLHYDGKTKITSRLDLILVLPTGETELIDFKFSSKTFKEYDDQKDLSIQYQMVFYKHLMQSKGIPVKSIMVKPFTMSMTKDGKVNAVESGPIENIGVSKSLTSNSKVVNVVNSYIPKLDMSTFSDYEGNDNIKKIYKEITGIDLTKSVDKVDVDHIIRTNVKQFNGEFQVLKYGSKVFVVPKEIKKDREAVSKWIIDKHYRDIMEFNENESLKVEAFIKSYKESVNDASKGIPSFDGSEKGTVYIAKAVAKYTKNNWEIVDRPELKDLGIIMMQRQLESGVEIDFLVYTNKKFNEVLKLAKGKKLLTGNFAIDSTAQQLDKQVNMSEATVLNAEALKAVLFVLNNSSLFTKNARLGTIKVLSKNTDHSAIDFNYMKDSLKYMFGKNYIKDDKIKKSLTFDYSVSPLEIYMNYLFEMINFYESEDNHAFYKEGIKKEVLGIKEIVDNHADKEDRRKLLAEFLRKKQAALVAKRNEEGNFSELEKRKEGLLGNTILFLKEIATPFDKDIKEWGNVYDTNAKFSTPTEISHWGVATVVKLFNNSIANLRSQYKDYKDDFRELDKPLMKESGYTVFDKYLIGNKDAIYQDLIDIKDEDGNLVYRIKDPKKIESPARRKFVEWVIETINNERTKNLTEEVKAEFMASDDARNLPLMNASMFTKLRKTEGGYLSALKAWSDEQTHRDEYLTNDMSSKNAIIEKTKMADRFAYNDSPNVESLERRKNLLKEANEATYESNLEIVLDAYIFSKLQKKNFDDVIYTASAVDATLALHQSEYGIRTEQARNFIKSHIETVAYNTPDLSEESKEIEDFILKLTTTTSVLAMGFNYTTGVAQMMQGMFGSMSEIIATRNEEHKFGFVSWGKAWSLVLGDSANNIGNISKLDHVNELYGIANIDINFMTNKLRERYGATALRSKFLYFTSTMPDYANRMTMLVAQMIEDGSYNAHTVVNDRMVYDMTKDARFSVFLNDKKDHQDYHKQKALYDLMLKTFQETDPEALVLVKDKYHFKKAYTNVQMKTFKEWSDSIYGAYDHESKTMFAKTAFGRLFMQFRTWLRARITRYNRSPTTNAHMQKIVYTTNPDGSVTAEFQGQYMEGILQTFMHIGKQINDADGLFAKLKKAYAINGSLNEEQRLNLQRLVGDMGMIALMVGAAEIARFLLKQNNIKNAFLDSTIRSMEFAATDLFIMKNLKFLVEPKNIIPAMGMVSKTWDITYKALTGEADPSTLLKISGMTRFIYYDVIRGNTSSGIGQGGSTGGGGSSSGW